MTRRYDFFIPAMLCSHMNKFNPFVNVLFSNMAKDIAICQTDRVHMQCSIYPLEHIANAKQRYKVCIYVYSLL